MLVVLLGLTAILLTIQGARKLKRSRTRLPPGPVPVPFLGNVLGVDTNAPHLTYTGWSKTYGGIVYIRILSQDIVLLNSEDVAVALLEKRSKIYSDRPVISIADTFGFDWPTTSARYGPRFRLHRRLIHQVFHTEAALDYRQKQLRKAYELLLDLLDDSTGYSTHFTTFAAAVVMAVTYGYDIKDGETFVSLMQRSADMFLRVARPEISALCAAFPFLKALPSWVPGMGFLSGAAECRSLASEAINAPYAWVKQCIDQGNAAPSMVADAITRHRLYDDTKDPELVQAVKESAATLYAASMETTHSILLIFVYLMMNHPEIQRRAQADIDRAVGEHRLPNFGDRTSLPYVDAILRETMRWHPVTPLLPHATTEDDVYEGYHIPKECIVLANIWAMSRDENKYPDPEVFLPERFLRSDGTLNEDSVPWIFGFGRRNCPGRHVGEASLWTAMVCMLALFSIEKTKGSDDVKWTTGFTTHPLPFPCRFVPRDEEMDLQKLSMLIYASKDNL